MNRAAVTHRAELLLFLWVFANGPIRRQNFIPVFIGLFDRIYLALMFRAVRLAGFATESFWRCAGGEEQP
jgi:hypothetical protein